MTPMGSQLQNGAFRDFLGEIPLKTALVIYGAKRLLCYSILPWPVDQENTKCDKLTNTWKRFARKIRALLAL